MEKDTSPEVAFPGADAGSVGNENDAANGWKCESPLASPVTISGWR